MASSISAPCWMAYHAITAPQVAMICLSPAMLRQSIGLIACIHVIQHKTCGSAEGKVDDTNGVIDVGLVDRLAKMLTECSQGRTQLEHLVQSEYAGHFLFTTVPVVDHVP